MMRSAAFTMSVSSSITTMPPEPSMLLRLRHGIVIHGGAFALVGVQHRAATIRRE